MATQMQLRGGTTAENLIFTGAQREITVDTDKDTLRVHDGITAGGFPLASTADVDDGTFYYNEDAGSAADAYILVPKANTNTPSSYLDGVQFGFVTTHPNTGPSTANFQGLGVKNLKYAGGTDPLAGEISGRVYLIYDAANGWMEIQRKATGAPPQIRTVGASVATSALTVTLAPCVIDFRSASLGSGVVNSRTVPSTLSLVVPSGATLGTVNAVASRIVLLAIYGPLNVELAVVNIAGGNNLDETGVISTTTISAASTAANVAYSATGRAGVPFRVIGFVDSTQTTAGNWAAAPSTIQGAGGQALAAMASLGYGQTYQDVTGSRVLGTTYTNTTGKPIFVFVSLLASASGGYANVAVNGVVVSSTSGASGSSNFSSPGTILVPPSSTYSVTSIFGPVTLNKWMELR